LKISQIEKEGAAAPETGLQTVAERRLGPDRRNRAVDYAGTERRVTERRSYSPDEVRTISSGLLRAVDLLVVVATGMFAYYLRHRSFDLPQIYIVAIGFTALLTFNYMQLFGAYRGMTNAFGEQMKSAGKAWLWIVGTLILVAFFTKTSDNFSRIWVMMWLAAGSAGLVIARSVFWLQISRWRKSGVLTNDLFLIGTREYCEELLARIRSEDDSQNIMGVFLIDDNNGDYDSIYHVPVLGGMDELSGHLFSTSVQQVILALPWDHPLLPELLDRLKTFNCEAAMSPGAVGFKFPDLGATRLHDTTLIRVMERPISGWGKLAKNLEDRILGVVFLLLSLPVMALIAIAVKLESPGAAIFQQRRQGFHNDEFVIYKFRSMRIDAPDDKTVRQATKGDARITRVGRILRRTSLDELPQLLNVVKGEMSLIGPRPHAVQHNLQFAEIIDQYLGRHKVKPGITGWAQVNGLRGETDTPEKMRRRVQADLHYIDNWSFLLDLKIILMTVWVCAGGRNAY